MLISFFVNECNIESALQSVHHNLGICRTSLTLLLALAATSHHVQLLVLKRMTVELIDILVIDSKLRYSVQ